MHNTTSPVIIIPEEPAQNQSENIFIRRCSTASAFCDAETAPRTENGGGGNTTTATAPNFSSRDSLYSSMKPLFSLGRFLSIIPCGRGDISDFNFPDVSCSSISSILVIAIMCTQITCSVHLLFDVEHGGRHGLMNCLLGLYSISHPLMSLILYFHFLRNADTFFDIFDKWDVLKSHNIVVADPWLIILLRFTMIFSFTITMIYHILFYADVVSNLRRMFVDIPILEAIQTVVPCPTVTTGHSLVTLPLVIFSTLTVLSLMFIPLLVAFYGRALSFQFEKLLELEANGNRAEIELVHSANLRNRDRSFWTTIVKRYKNLLRLTETIDIFISPLLLVWIPWKIFVISIQVYLAIEIGVDLKAEQTPRASFWISLCVRILEFLIAVISAAKVNNSALKILRVFRKCPKELYSDTEVRRLERRVAIDRARIGLTGGGCFTLTRPLVLKFLSVIFILEILFMKSSRFIKEPVKRTVWGRKY